MKKINYLLAVSFFTLNILPGHTTFQNEEESTFSKKSPAYDIKNGLKSDSQPNTPTSTISSLAAHIASEIKLGDEICIISPDAQKLLKYICKEAQITKKIFGVKFFSTLPTFSNGTKFDIIIADRIYNQDGKESALALEKLSSFLSTRGILFHNRLHLAE